MRPKPFGRKLYALGSQNPADKGEVLVRNCQSNKRDACACKRFRVRADKIDKIADSVLGVILRQENLKCFIDIVVRWKPR
jgi:hypothetical protein